MENKSWKKSWTICHGKYVMESRSWKVRAYWKAVGIGNGDLHHETKFSFIRQKK